MGSKIRMDNVTLYRIDARDASNQHSIGLNTITEVIGADAAIRNVHVLLLGFDSNNLIDYHRHLFELGVPSAQCHALLPDQAKALSEVSTSLLNIAVEHMVAALNPSKIVDVATRQVHNLIAANVIGVC